MKLIASYASFTCAISVSSSADAQPSRLFCGICAAHRSRIEVVEIGQQIAQRVADFAVFVAEFLDRLRAGGDVVLIVDAAAPEPQQIGAVAVDLLRRR